MPVACVIFIVHSDHKLPLVGGSLNAETRKKGTKMLRVKKGMFGVLAAAALAAGAATQANAVLIDTFNADPDSLTSGAGPAGPSTTATAEAIGGFRTIEILTSAGAGLNTSAAVLAPIPGVYSHSEDALKSGSSKITWDANGAGLGGVDFTAGGDDRITMSILSIDQGNVDLILTVMDTGAGVSTLLINNAGVGAFDALYANFVGTADFTDVNSVMLEVQAGVASDLVLDLVETTNRGGVPEPATLSLLGLAGLMGLRRRRTA